MVKPGVTSEWQLVKASRFAVFGSEDAVKIVAILVGDFQELVAIVHQAWVGLGSSLYGAWFTAAGTFGHQIFGQDPEELVLHRATSARRSGLEQCLSVAAGGGQAPGKAHPLQGHVVATGGFEHETAHQVVHQEMHPDFPLQIRGCLTAVSYTHLT